MDNRFKNIDNDPRGPWASGPCHAKTPNEKSNYPIISPSGKVFYPPSGTSWRFSKAKFQELIGDNRIWFGENGHNVPRFKRFLTDVKNGLVPITLWFKDEVGDNQEAKSEAKQIDSNDVFSTPKPERLLQRILHLASEEGDLILDSFLGSGTTAAVAHKMGRRWIGIELGDHCETHCVPRLKKVIDGEDQGGISKAVNWKGGGGFRYYRLAPSLILEDEWGNEVINKDYNPAMLAEAVCKLNGFIYSPSDECYWMHGHSTETDYIYITTQAMTVSMLEKISDEVGDDRSLLVCCSSFRCNAERFENLTLNKIPKSVLNKCQWGRDDYSLQIENLPQAPEEPEPEEKPKGKTKEDRKHGATLF